MSRSADGRYLLGRRILAFGKKAESAEMTEYPHIEKRADGKLWLIGTQTKVIEVILDRLAHHWDADEIQRQHPHLSLGQIHSSLAYYHDHQDDMDRVIEEQLRRVEAIRGQQGPSALNAKLAAKGLAS